MIFNLKEYREIHEQKKSIIWDFVLKFYECDYVKSAKVYKELTNSVKSTNKSYNMIINKLRGNC